MCRTLYLPLPVFAHGGGGFVTSWLWFRYELAFIIKDLLFLKVSNTVLLRQYQKMCRQAGAHAAPATICGPAHDRARTLARRQERLAHTQSRGITEAKPRLDAVIGASLYSTVHCAWLGAGTSTVHCAWCQRRHHTNPAALVRVRLSHPHARLAPPWLIVPASAKERTEDTPRLQTRENKTKHFAFGVKTRCIPY